MAGSCLAISGFLVAAPASNAARDLTTGFADPLLASPDPAVRAFWLDRTVQADANLVRLSVSWASIAPNRPATPGDPGDPGYNFGPLDAVIKDVVARGLTPILTVAGAPSWAEGPGRPADAAPGSWRPDPAQFGLFASALAQRYGGGFRDPVSPLTILPRVRLFQALNEPNLSIYLSPQWRGRKSIAPRLYRQLLNAFYDGVKGVHADDLVVSAGTAPFGDSPGGQRTRPLAFWRGVLCLRERGKRIRATRCRNPAKLDILAHHPINTIPSPGKHALNPDDAASADMGRVRQLLRAAERRHTIRPAGHRPLWATEMWWDTNPPDAAYGVSPGRQALFIEKTLFLIWRGGASAAINLQVGDAPTGDFAPGQVMHSGLFNSDGSPKPAFTAFEFPFVTQRNGRGRIMAWGKTPASGTLAIQRLTGGGWRTLKSLSMSRGQVFATRLKKLGGKLTLRATIGGQSSLLWVQGRR